MKIHKKSPESLETQVETKPFDQKAALEDIRRKSLGRMNIQPPARPTVKGQPLDPRLPPDMTALSDVDLGKLYSEFCCMAQFVQLHMAVRSVELAMARREDRMTRAKVRLEKSGTNLDKEAKTDLDPRSQTSGFALLLEEGTHTLTEAVMQSFIIGRDAISRELTRRIAMTHNSRNL